MRKIDIWQMAQIHDTGSVEHIDGDEIPSESPLHLLSLNTESLRVSALSPDGNWFAFATEDKLKLYSLNIDGLNISINKEQS